MVKALGKKLSQRPGIIGIRTNEGTRVSIKKAARERVKSARITSDYKGQD